MAFSRWFGRFVLALLGLAASAVAAAQSTTPLERRADELIALFNGKAKPAEMFTPAFLAAVPETQLEAISKQVTAQLGAARSVSRVDEKSGTGGTVRLDFERGTAELSMTIEATPPHRIQGLLITGTRLTNDSFASIVAELEGLPGETALSVARLTETGPESLVAHNADHPLAIGSTFKLFLLAELSRSIAAGERKWNDVVPLTHHSLPSGFLQNWPEGSPLTLHTLAGLMISQSDNSATDTLLHLLGRERVEELLPELRVHAAGRNRPFLSTLEAFALKADRSLRREWTNANEAQRRRLLTDRLDAVDPSDIDVASLGNGPIAIDAIEWFASPADLVRTMDWLRRHGGERTLALLAINPGVGSATAAGVDFVGFKGGSEAGVINLTFLVRNKANQWYAVSGSWNNETAALDDSRFAMLMERAVSLLR
jgi:hypothetical protein